jgi:hypothetical protein
MAQWDMKTQHHTTLTLTLCMGIIEGNVKKLVQCIKHFSLKITGKRQRTKLTSKPDNIKMDFKQGVQM